MYCLLTGPLRAINLGVQSLSSVAEWVVRTGADFTHPFQQWRAKVSNELDCCFVLLGNGPEKVRADAAKWTPGLGRGVA